ncbi:TolB family protein [Aliikangiella sp. IMCC44359]|uniref:TolB family protein n=1 Tax=Aliikangiella sp. IMCC44359 TaxID=3459125 RepID=UPI00403A8DC8
MKFTQLVIIPVGVMACSSFSASIFATEYRPGMDIFLYQVIQSDKGKRLKLVKNISNQDGYDNQPSFSPDNQRLLYVSNRDGKQTDIYEYHLETKKDLRLTQTSYSEYSPMMEKGNKTFTAVREGGQPYQSVHRYKYQSDTSSWAVKTHTPIGYYAFNNQGTVAAWARWANSLYLVQPEEKEALFITGYALPSKPLLIPKTNSFSFVHRQANDALWIKSVEPATRAITPIAPVLNNNIDYTWTPDGNIVSGNNDQLFIWQKNKKDWHLWADLSGDNLGQISRLAVSNDFRYVAVVAKVKKDHER